LSTKPVKSGYKDKMRSSKSRQRSKPNRPRPIGNIVNRVFDSSGPDGKVRGTPQQIIEKYQFLARDAQLSNDRVAAENFQQHAEHFTRILAEAQKEIAAEQEMRAVQAATLHATQNQSGERRDEPSENRSDKPREERSYEAASSNPVSNPTSAYRRDIETIIGGKDLLNHGQEPLEPAEFGASVVDLASEQDVVDGSGFRKEQRETSNGRNAPRVSKPERDREQALGRPVNAEAKNVLVDDDDKPARKSRIIRKPKPKPESVVGQSNLTQSDE
jgi:hypothetical protein